MAMLLQSDPYPARLAAPMGWLLVALAACAAGTAQAQVAPVPPPSVVAADALSTMMQLAPAKTDTRPAGAVEEGLRQVLDDALAANLELRAGTAGVRQRVAALDRARARYLPVLDFDARYSVADGGRTIEFPVGDLLNPVYETLDDLLVQSGQPASFPRAKNQQINLLLPQEQNTRFVLAQPLYEPRLAPAVEGSRQNLNRAEADLSGLRTLRPTRACTATGESRATWSIVPRQTCWKSSRTVLRP
jgi:hypothetical protein